LNHYIDKQFLNKINYIALINNYFAFGLQVTLGFLVVAIISNYMSLSQLGIFTQTYTILVIVSQFTVLGFNDTILKKLSSISKNENERKIIINIFASVLINAFCLSLMFYFFKDILYSLFNSNSLKEANKYIYIAIFFLTINKVFFSILQGKRLLNSFAFFNFFRPFLIFTLISFALFLSISINFSLVFTIAEILIFITLSLRISLHKYFDLSQLNIFYIKNNYSFGLRVFFNSFVSESFIRIDIIMVGILLDDKFVGIYSLAALFFEGIYQFSIVIRNVINPEIGKLYKDKKYNILIKLIRYSSSLSFVLIVAFSVIVYFILPYILFFLDINVIDQVQDLLIFLLIGLTFYSIIIPSENLLFQSNHPSGQSLYMVSLVILNILLNYVLILNFGILGAAMGTAITYSSSVIIFNLYVILLTKLKRGIFFYNHQVYNT